MLKTTASARYDSVARSLHWLSAALIAVVFTIGLTIDVPPKSFYPAYLDVHVLLGLTILALAIVRLAWRAGHAAPPPPPETGAIWALAIKIGHGALYLMMVVVPLIGLAPLFTRGRGIDFGLFEIPSPIARTREWVHTTTEIHEIAAYALIALAVGHAAAAIYHQVALKDGVLDRMLPQRGR